MKLLMVGILMLCILIYGYNNFPKKSLKDQPDVLTSQNRFIENPNQNIINEYEDITPTVQHDNASPELEADNAFVSFEISEDHDTGLVDPSIDSLNMEDTIPGKSDADDIIPTKVAASFVAQTVDPDTLNQLDPHGHAYVDIWQIELDENINTLKVGDIFSFPDLYNTNTNIVLYESNERILKISENEQHEFQEYFGYPIESGPGQNFNLSSWVENGVKRYQGGYQTLDGEYKIKSDDSGKVYLLKHNPEAPFMCAREH